MNNGEIMAQADNDDLLKMLEGGLQRSNRFFKNNGDLYV